MTFKLRGEPRKLQTSIILEAYTLAAVEACEDPILAQGIREQGRTGPWFAFAPHANLLSILEHHTGVVTARDENDDPVIFDLKVDRFKPEQSQPPRAHDNRNQIEILAFLDEDADHVLLTPRIVADALTSDEILVIRSRHGQKKVSPTRKRSPRRLSAAAVGGERPARFASR